MDLLMQPLLKATAISKQFPGTQVLDNVSLELAPGEIHAVIGENGAGKSTLMKILAGVLSPDSGIIEFEGQAVTFLNPHDALMRNIVCQIADFSCRDVDLIGIGICFPDKGYFLAIG